MHILIYVCSHNLKTTHSNFAKFFVLDAYGCGFILLWQHFDTLMYFWFRG